MTHGFNLEDDLVCEGIIGDGCGGGRIFFIKENTLFAHDPQTKENMKLLENIHMCPSGATNAICVPRSISKKACIITIECEQGRIEFDLSAMKKK